jgi:hypothetical protein
MDMITYKVKAPILFLIFNRPKETQIVFDAIKNAKPKKLYVAADGPRNNGTDILLCLETKKILNQIDWDCELITLFREENLGCKIAVSEAITWFFNNEEEGIVLEDDCLPNLDFFRFCDLHLEKYRFDNRIGHICGCNFQDNTKRGEADYYFSRLIHVWGWASWRRVWLNYDINMKNLETAQKIDFLSALTDNKNVKRFLYDCFLKTKKGLINTWDYQYFYSNFINGFLSIIPNNNMISNIGFNETGTHTFDLDSPLANIKHQPLPLKINHAVVFIANRLADTYTLLKEVPSSYEQVYTLFKQKVKKIVKCVL